MAVISLRLNQQETEMIDFLSSHYEQDKSALIKYSLRELYEDIVDREFITNYEKRENKRGISFISSADALKMIYTHK
jgi:predicted DNA-binding protein